MPSHRNLLIEAGAGTGKTTRLVKAMLQALFIRQIPLEAIVALTFTNKAAGELKDRVGHALEDVLTADAIDMLRKKPWWPTPEPILSLTDLQKLAQAATTVLDRSNISTIHSFAFSLLKRFPLAAGIDPEASIDDKGLRFDALFRREWPLWLSVELSAEPPREALWMELLSKLTLSQIEEAARELADFGVPLEKIRIREEDLPKRLEKPHEEARTLVADHSGKLNADKVARACEEILGIGAHGAWKKLDELSTDTLENITASPGNPKAWSEKELARLKMLQAVAKNVLARGDRVIALLTEALEPFCRAFRQTLLREGCLTHSALLYLSRDIVKNFPDIRAALKQTIQMILIDEFQDTDPLQAELLLYLAEKSGHTAQAWDEVQLEDGKLFIVGDPKQSIYRFRGADIAAYERIGKLLVKQGGLQETLEVNYRSQAQIIQVVNQAFDRIISHEPEISPPYAAVAPHHSRDTAHAVQDVEIWLAQSNEAQSVEEAQATEADHAARWIKEAQNQLTVHDPREGKRRPLLYRDVALIFRSYSPMDRFIEALRRYDIPFAVESERYFFTTPEVTDFINLLRAADDPNDTLSLVGYLRGPLAGLTDGEILRRKNAGTLEEVESVQWLRTITARLGREPLADVLRYIFDHTFLLEMAARSYHGDQTVANLLKLRRLLENFASEGLTTMGLLLKKLEEFFADDKIEGESPLADENYNAVRLLTIHKAKGLEYPVVFLPSLHSGRGSHKASPFVYDWRGQTLGLTIGGFSNLDKLLLNEQNQRREIAEDDRILYVAMTRARERLVLSGGVNLKANSSKTYLNKLLSAWNLSLENLAEGDIGLNETSIHIKKLPRVTIREEAAKPANTDPLRFVDPATFAKVWRERAEQRKNAEATPLVLTPTSVDIVGADPRVGPQSQLRPPSRSISASSDSISEPSDFISGPTRGAAPTMIGTLIHLFLEHWDFTCEKCSMPALLTRLANSYFAQQGLLRTPLPDPKEGKLKLEETDPMTEVVAIVDEAQKILADFIDSEAYDEIKGAEILGREVPFFYTVTPHPSPLTPQTIMRGTIDILYRLPSGQTIIGDYKTGQTQQDYTAQKEAYLAALKLSLGEDALFKIISLREGTAALL